MYEEDETVWQDLLNIVFKFVNSENDLQVDAALQIFNGLFSYIIEHLNKYKDWTCNAGLESLMINWDGDVHRATCRVGGSLGNIYDDSFVAPNEPVVCDRNFCTCASDIPITKHANNSN
jgi:MoaA/NifB/PqqE/SkfB family radical SAM enzyme